jgi:FG-GAP-like repeat
MLVNRKFLILPFLAFLTLSSLAAPPVADVSYIASRDYPVAGLPTGVASGDFNGNGKPDLATVNFSSNNVSVLINNGNGTYRPAVNYPVGTGPQAISVGDFNGDGKADIVVISGSGISILLGNGDGTFQTQKLTTISIGTAPDSLAIGDFDGDGKLDVAATLALPQVGQRAVAVFLGNGDGTLQAPMKYDSGSGAGSVIAGKFMASASIDLAVTDTKTSSISILPNNGHGVFQAAVNTPAVNPLGPIAAGDFNNDGKLDIVMASTAGGGTTTLSVFLATGGGSFSAPIASSAPFIPSSVVVGDFNGDGFQDLLVLGRGSVGVAVLLGKGNGTFQQSAAFLLGPMGSTAGAAVDVNGDGKLDFAALSEGPGLIYVVLGAGDGTFHTASNTTVPPSLSVSFSVLAGDFDGDGKADLIVANSMNSTGNLYFLRGSGDGTFLAPVIIAHPVFPVGGHPCVNCSQLLAAGDLNSDGKLDLVMAIPGNNTMGVLLGNGDGTFQALVEYAAGTVGITSVGIGDFNADGKPDVVAVDNNGGLFLFIGNGDGTFGFAQASSIHTGAYFLAVGDINKDGNMDVAVAGAAVTILLGNGHGGFQAGVDTALASPANGIALGDLNHTGNLDVVVAIPNPASGPAPSPLNTVAVLLDGGSPTYYPVGVTPVGVTLRDLNSDGSMDIVTSNQDSGDVSILLGRGDGTFQPAEDFAALGSGLAATVADFDGDGIPDIAVAVGASGVSLLLSRGIGSAPTAQLMPNAVNFAAQPVGTPSASSSAALKNTGNAALSLGAITIGGSQSGDFSQTNDCGSSLAPGSSCTFHIIFTPFDVGARTANIQIADNAFNTPQLIALSGTGTPAPPDFIVSAPSASSTIVAGHAATFSLTITSTSGFTQPVSLSCTGQPTASTCSVSPTSVTPSSSAAVTATVTITTTARSTALVPSFSEIDEINPLQPHFPAALGVLILILIATSFVRRCSQRPLRLVPAAAFAAVLAAAIAAASCGGGSSSTGPTPASGTPAGTYTITVSASSTAGSTTVTHTTNLTLVVQ